MNIFLEGLTFLFYTIFILWVVNKWSYFTESGISKKWLNTLFVLKVLIGFLLYLIYTKYYSIRAEADIFKYFDDSLIVYNAVFKSPLDYIQLVFFKAPDNQYFYDNYYTKMNHWANLHNSIFYGDSILMIKINAFFRLFSFGSFHIHSLFFNFLSFIGLIGIFKFFNRLFRIKSSWLTMVVFCMPSVLFWSSSVLKESLLLLLLGIIFNQLLMVTKENRSYLKPLFLILIAVFFLALLKFYIVVALLIPLSAYLVNSFYTNNYNLVTYFFMTIGFMLLFFNSSLVDTLILKQNDFLNLVSTTNAGSYFELPILEPNFLSVLSAVPNGILNCFIQPIPTSKVSVMAVPAMLENLIIILGLVAAFPIMVKRRNWMSKDLNVLIFIMLFTIILFAIIGVTTPVAGALVRYKVGALPFLGIFILYFLQLKLKSK